MPEEELLEIRVASREAEILGAADRAPRLKLALVELVQNAVEHGNAFDPRKLVTVRVRRAGRRLLISVADEGRGLDPGAVDQDLEEVALDLESADLRRDLGQRL